MDAGDPRHNPGITGSEEDTYGTAKEERESGAKHGQGHYAQAPSDEADSNEAAKPDPPSGGQPEMGRVGCAPARRTTGLARGGEGTQVATPSTDQQELEPSRPVERQQCEHCSDWLYPTALYECRFCNQAICSPTPCLNPPCGCPRACIGDEDLRKRLTDTMARIDNDAELADKGATEGGAGENKGSTSNYVPRTNTDSGVKWAKDATSQRVSWREGEESRRGEERQNRLNAVTDQWMREKGYKRIDEIIENCPTRRLEEQRIAMGIGPTPGLKELREHHDAVRRAEAEVATSQESYYFDGDSAFDHSQPAEQPTEEGEEEEQEIREDVEATKEEDSDEDPKGGQEETSPKDSLSSGTAASEETKWEDAEVKSKEENSQRIAEEQISRQDQVVDAELDKVDRWYQSRDMDESQGSQICDGRTPWGGKRHPVHRGSRIGPQRSG